MSDGRFPPSPKRLREARARGEVAYSSLLTAAAALSAGALTLGLTGRAAATRVMDLARRCWSGQGDASLLLPTLNAIVLPLAAAIFAAALGAGLLQTRGLFAWGAFGQPRRDDDDAALPLVSLATSLLLVVLLLSSLRAVLLGGGHAGTLTAAAASLLEAVRVFVPRALVLLALAGLADFAWRRSRLLDALSMTRAERERERREDEGDPRLRAEQRRRGRALARDPLVDELARAQVLLLAEGLAVALREVDGVARVAASLAGAAGDERLRAQRMAAIARQLGVPVRVDDQLTELLTSLPINAPVPSPQQPRALALIRASRRRDRR